MADNLYTFSRQEAKSLGRLAQWKQSHRDNIKCARDIDNLIASHTKDNQLGADCAKAALERWGFQRVKFVLANTLVSTGGSGFEPESLQWARSVYVPPDKTNEEFKIKVDGPLLAQFIQQAHAEYQALGLFGAKHCVDGELDYTGKVLILRPGVLKEESLCPQNQLWYAQSGFGCSPASSGRAVYATCLGDGEKARWNRTDFIGVLDKQYLPDWTAEQLTELRGPALDQTDSPSQGGMEMG